MSYSTNASIAILKRYRLPISEWSTTIVPPTTSPVTYGTHHIAKGEAQTCLTKSFAFIIPRVFAIFTRDSWAIDVTLQMVFSGESTESEGFQLSLRVASIGEIYVKSPFFLAFM